MKAEKRHQLQRNALADGMGRLLQSMKSSPKSNSTLVWAFVITALATLVLWQYGAHATQSRYSTLWTQVDMASRDWASGPRELSSISGDNPGSFPARSARFQLARLQFANGQKDIRSFLDRNKAVDSLRAAWNLYARLVDDCLDSPLLAQEAMMGVAQSEESLIGVPRQENSSEVFSLDQALEAYARLKVKYPDSILGKQAAERIDQINGHRAEIETFYADLNRWAAIQPKMDVPKSEPVPEIKEPAPVTAPKDSLPKAGPAAKTVSPEPSLKTNSKTPFPGPESKGGLPKTDTKAQPAKAEGKDKPK